MLSQYHYRMGLIRAELFNNSLNQIKCALCRRVYLPTNKQTGLKLRSGPWLTIAKAMGSRII